MPSENLELVQRGYELYNRDGPEALLRIAPLDFEWHPNPDDPEQGVRRGVDELRASLRDLEQAFERIEVGVTEIFEADERVVAVVHHVATVHGSEAVVERDEVHVWTFSEGVPASLHEYPSREEARAAIEAD